MKGLICVFTALSLVGMSLACSSTIAKNKKNPKPREVKTAGSNEISPRNRHFLTEEAGVDSFEGFDDSGFGDGIARNADDLSCDFEGRSSCCWRNSQPPKDELEYIVVRGDIRRDVSEKFLGTQNAPRGRYLVTYVEQAQSSVEARFESCEIRCTEDEIIVDAQVWQGDFVPDRRSANPYIEVCLQRMESNRKDLFNCRNLEPNSNGVATAALPPISENEPMQIIIRSSGFEDGGVTVIDDIKVDYRPCDDRREFRRTTRRPDRDRETRRPDRERVTRRPDRERVTRRPDRGRVTRPPRGRLGQNIGGGAGGACRALTGDFERDPGTWAPNNDFSTPSTDPERPTAWELVERRKFRNGVTGLRRGAKSSRGYLASGLQHPGELAVMESASFDLPEDTYMKMDVWEATADLQMRVCVAVNRNSDVSRIISDTVNCPFVSNRHISVNDRGWREEVFILPRGTTKVYVVCDNEGSNNGACGMDNVELQGAPGSRDDGRSICR